MAILSISSLPLWLQSLSILSLARQSACSPLSITGYNSLVQVVPTVNGGLASPNNESATSLISSTNLKAPIPNCATLPNYAEWFQPSERFDNDDCPKAMELFFNDYTKDHEGAKYEFLASGVTPVHGIPTQRVPLKVVYGTCAVVIAMRNMFLEGELPGETPFRSAGSDVSSFTQLYHNAQEIYAKCSQPEPSQPGWYPAGDLNSIGVFLWQSASEINTRIKRVPHAGLLLPLTSRDGMVGDIFDHTAQR